MAESLYIHWPFCARKCPYCDFNSHVRTQIDTALWQQSLITDMRREAEHTAGQTPLKSIFFGGGTPSLMPPALVETLLTEAERLWGFAPNIEITLEANPSSVEAANFAALATTGVNRISLGVQAIDDNTLKFLGRLHGADEALAALAVAQSHFARVSIDLIYARPSQTPEQWQAELTRALALGTGHISLYQLTIEPGTRFATDVREHRFTPLPDDPAADLFTLTRELTAAAGLPAYEVSNHARPGEESRHNLTYWRYGDYAGIGPGAHGRRPATTLTERAHGRRPAATLTERVHGHRNATATIRHKKPENWLSAIATQGDGIAEHRPLPPREQAAEALLMGLRLAEGIDPAALATRFALLPTDLIDPKAVARYAAQGLVETYGTRLIVTETGMPVLNALIAELVADGLT